MSTFRTSCGHEVTVKPVEKVGGKMQGKWCIRVKGPKVTGSSGIKTIYTEANQTDVIQKVSKFLRVSPAALRYQPVASPARSHANTAEASLRPVAAPPPRGPVPAHAPHDKFETSCSSRASCRACSQKIQKGTMRVGLLCYDARYPNRANDFLYYHDQCYPDKDQLRLGCSVQDHLAKQNKKRVKENALLQERRGLWIQLQSLRTIFARRLEKPPYCIYEDAIINDICLKLPTTKQQLFDCYGIAEKRWQNFGESILMVVRMWLSSQPSSSTTATTAAYRSSVLSMPGTVTSPRDIAGATSDDEDGILQVGETLSCEEIVNRKFEHARKTGYIISID